MIKIYGSPHSSAGRVYWTALEAGVPFERIPLNMRDKAHKSPDYLKLNPNGKVPTMVDGNFVMWESTPITFYLAEKYKPELLGNSLEERALINQWSTWAMTEMQPAHVDLLIQKVFVPADKQDHAVIERSLKAIPPKLEILDRHLSGRSHVVANRFTLADLNLVSVVGINKSVGNDISSFKNIEKWLKGIADRPAFMKFMNLER